MCGYHGGGEHGGRFLHGEKNTVPINHIPHFHLGTGTRFNLDKVGVNIRVRG